jgi:hypothetical protein
MGEQANRRILNPGSPARRFSGSILGRNGFLEGILLVNIEIYELQMKGIWHS